MTKVYDFGPLFAGAEHYGPEPSLRELVEKYYAAHFEPSQVKEFVAEYFRQLPRHNGYDKTDMVQLVSTVSAGPMKFGAYRVRDPETMEWSSIQFHLTYDNMVMGVMGENSAKLFATLVLDTLK